MVASGGGVRDRLKGGGGAGGRSRECRHAGTASAAVNPSSVKIATAVPDARPVSDILIVSRSNQEDLSMTIRLLALTLLFSVASMPSLVAQAAAQEAPTRRPDVIYVPTPEEVVEAMLQVAAVTKNDIVYDLGCGDGRIPVTAASKYGARAVCVDIDPQRIKEATENVTKNKVGDRVRIVQGDLFEQNLSEATVVTLYLLPSLNVKLMPKLMKELRPGTRIVSHAFDMGDWKPEKELDVNGRKVYFWTIPRR
jgi:precorrin-6B methylase 2